MAQTVQLQVTWQGDQAFLARSNAGAQTLMGSYRAQHALAPMETLLAAVAGCSGVDVVLILGKMRKTLQALDIRIQGQRRDEHPRVYTHVHLAYILHGPDLDEASVERAIRLSLEKYCSAAATVGAYARITFDFEIHTGDRVLRREALWLKGTPAIAPIP